MQACRASPIPASACSAWRFDTRFRWCPFRGHRRFSLPWSPVVCPPTLSASADSFPPSGENAARCWKACAARRAHRCSTKRYIVLAREVTKVHEEFLRGRASEVLATLKSRGEVKGEITLLIAKAEQSALRPGLPRPNLRERLHQIMSEEKLDEKAALKRVAREMGVSKSEAYRELQRSK